MGVKNLREININVQINLKIGSSETFSKSYINYNGFPFLNSDNEVFLESTPTDEEDFLGYLYKTGKNEKVMENVENKYYLCLFKLFSNYMFPISLITYKGTMGKIVALNKFSIQIKAWLLLDKEQNCFSFKGVSLLLKIFWYKTKNIRRKILASTWVYEPILQMINFVGNILLTQIKIICSIPSLSLFFPFLFLIQGPTLVDALNYNVGSLNITGKLFEKMDLLEKTMEDHDLDILLLQDVHSNQAEIKAVRKRFKELKIIFSAKKYKNKNNLKGLNKMLNDKYEIVRNFSKNSLINPFY
jgi:hypothetical protein